jgi:hypothetical protein
MRGILPGRHCGLDCDFVLFFPGVVEGRFCRVFAENVVVVVVQLW